MSARSITAAGAPVGILVEDGRLRWTRLALRDGRPVLVPPRIGLPVLDDTGGIHPRLGDYLDGLGFSRAELDRRGLHGILAGVVEIELTIEPEVPEEAARKLLEYLRGRGIAVVPPEAERSPGPSP